MALMTETRFNSDTGRHELWFVNQQYEPLMSIAYDQTLGAYAYDCPLEEARRLMSAAWPADGDALAFLARAASDLLERDRSSG